MKINSGKSRILYSGNDIESVNIGRNGSTSEKKSEVLDIVLDLDLSFEDHRTLVVKEQIKNSIH